MTVQAPSAYTRRRGMDRRGEFDAFEVVPGDVRVVDLVGDASQARTPHRHRGRRSDVGVVRGDDEMDHLAVQTEASKERMMKQIEKGDVVSYTGFYGEEIGKVSRI